MSFRNVSNLLGGGSSGTTIVGGALTVPITVAPIVVFPNGAVNTMATYALPDNMKNAQMYVVSVSGSISDTDNNALGVVNLYWSANEDGSGDDGTETYLSWESVNEGVPPPLGVGPNILKFGIPINYTGPLTRATAISASTFNPGPPTEVGTITELIQPPGTCFTNQINMWYHPRPEDNVENLFFIAQNLSETNTAINIKTPLTIRVTAFF